MSQAERRKIFQEYFTQRRHRRDKLSRAFKNVCSAFDILGNLGFYRDLHRHRILTQERQNFTTVHGYDTPPEIEEAGFKSEFDGCMKHAAEFYERIYADLPGEAQYVVPFAYKIRWYMKMNLREALHMCESAPCPKDIRITVSSARRCGAGFRKFIQRWRSAASLSIGKISVGTVAVGDADGV